MIERTLVLLKPDAVQRCHSGEIIQRLERAGLKIVGMKMVWATKEMSKKHYKAHVEKKFYPGLEQMLTEGPVIAMAIEGVDAIEVVRKLIGGTEPKTALPGTIRGDFAHASFTHADERAICLKNLIHASSSKEDAKDELQLWFNPEELHSYKTVHDLHVI